MFVSLANNVNSKNNDVKTDLASENIYKGKSILGAPLKLEKVVTKNPRTKKGNNQKFKKKKQHLCHHCGAFGHTQPNCYKWLATQQSNNMISSGNHNQFPSSFAPLRDLLKAPHVPFEFERFQFFPLTAKSRVCQTERFFQGVEGKRLKVI